MKCPKCGEAGAYEPLMRPIECANHACGLYSDKARDDVISEYVNSIGYLKVLALDLRVGDGTKELSFPIKPLVSFKHICDPMGCVHELTSWLTPVNKKIADRLFLMQHDSVQNRYSGTCEATFVIRGSFDNEEDMREAEKMVKSILNKMIDF